MAWATVVNKDKGEFSTLISVPTLARDGHAKVIERMAELVEQVIA